eukprot:TRINITY_DN48441_c0_g1_i1.p1 TRINITY_DN48441_c0_g1~~TRINITY_DN48441_c0_g1_i1.p1  ORF type:complete len:265 (-),score=38.35 TRINITY_DN48441_c0_g1_i1:55-849(-)
MGGAPSLIMPNLWLGGQDVLDDASFFANNNITCVLSLGPASPSPKIRLIAREHVNLPDVPTADLSMHFPRIVRFIASCRHAGRCVYVHCAAGISRSTTSLIAYLMAHLQVSFDEALRFVSSKRPAVCPNEGFTRQLKRFECSKEREALAQELTQAAGYEEQRARDLEEIRQVPSRRSTGGRRSLSGGSSKLPEQQARQRALQAVRQAAGPAALRLGDGSQIGDAGLGWLVPASQRRSASSARGQPSLPSRAAREHSLPSRGRRG